MKTWMFLIAVIYCLAAASSATAAALPAPGQSLVLFYSNNVQGETEPCG